MDTKQLNAEYAAHLDKDRLQTHKDTKAVIEKMSREAALSGRMPVRFALIPKLFTPEIMAHFSEIVDTLYGVLIKIMRAYLRDASFRKRFLYSRELEELVLSPCGYESLLPILRMDLFYDEDTSEFMFCELNTDGTSGMKEELDISGGLSFMHAYTEFTKFYDLTRTDTVKGWCEAFLRIYRSYEAAKEKPYIAIADFIESGEVVEFNAIKNCFIGMGYDAGIIDIRDFTYENGSLTHGGRVVDAVYRRAVTGEMMDKLDTIQPFRQAILDGKACVIGHPRTQIAHNKMLFVVLHTKEALDLLSESERDFIKKHIPFTARLESGNYDYSEVRRDKNKWVIKPVDLYASKNVFVGTDTPQDEWENTLKEYTGKDYILQKYCPPYISENAYYDEQEQKIATDRFYNLTGLYVFDGKFSGIYSRMNSRTTITSHRGGLSAASLSVSAKA